jgi:hypothetical protein
MDTPDELLCPGRWPAAVMPTCFQRVSIQPRCRQEHQQRWRPSTAVNSASAAVQDASMAAAPAALLHPVIHCSRCVQHTVQHTAFTRAVYLLLRPFVRQGASAAAAVVGSS